jgi:hypothetical protein
MPSQPPPLSTYYPNPKQNSLSCKRLGSILEAKKFHKNNKEINFETIRAFLAGEKCKKSIK